MDTFTKISEIDKELEVLNSENKEAVKKYNETAREMDDFRDKIIESDNELLTLNRQLEVLTSKRDFVAKNVKELREHREVIRIKLIERNGETCIIQKKIDQLIDKKQQYQKIIEFIESSDQEDFKHLESLIAKQQKVQEQKKLKEFKEKHPFVFKQVEHGRSLCGANCVCTIYYSSVEKAKQARKDSTGTMTYIYNVEDIAITELTDLTILNMINDE